MSPQRRNNPDIEAPSQEFPSRPPTEEMPGIDGPSDVRHGTVGRDEEE